MQTRPTQLPAIVVTGTAGFIGFHLAARLLAEGRQVRGIDNLGPYYEPALKRARLRHLEGQAGFTFLEADINDASALDALFANASGLDVVHLAAQAGVRYSLENPAAYAHSNLDGFLAVLEACRRHGARRLLYASSSSVYGLGAELPFSTEARTDSPASLYAATKKANEVMAHAYAHLYRIPAVGLRFFTVYGPWGRPDMAPFLFAHAILAGEPLRVFNNGEMERDFTYIDDVVEALSRLLARPDVTDGAITPHRLFNIGGSQPIKLMSFIQEIEQAIGKKSKKTFMPMQPGDVRATWADCAELEREIGYVPETRLEDGIVRFIAWYRDYYDL